jgi:hypothetical protein
MGWLGGDTRKREAMSEQSNPREVPPRTEESWRLRLKMEEALRRYRTAAHYRKMLQNRGEGLIPLMRARQGEFDALAEYNRIVRNYTELTVCGLEGPRKANKSSAPPTAANN